MDTAELKNRLDFGEALHFRIPSEDPDLMGIVWISKKVPDGVVPKVIGEPARVRTKRKFVRARRGGQALYCVSIREEPTPAAIKRDPVNELKYRFLGLNGFARITSVEECLRTFGHELSQLALWDDYLQDPAVVAALEGGLPEIPGNQ